MFNVGEFKGHLENRGVLRPNKFMVQVPIPAGMTNANVSGREEVVAVGKDFSFFAEAVSLPGVGLLTDETLRYGYGPLEKKPYVAAFTDVRMVVRADKDGKIFDFLHAWQRLCYDYELRSTIGTVGGILPSQYPFEATYKADYAVDVTIVLYNEVGGAVTSVILREAFPSMIADVPLDWAASPELVKFTVILTYHDWYSAAVPLVHKDNLPAEKAPIIVKA
jgi:hypothetical protein